MRDAIALFRTARSWPRDYVIAAIVFGCVSLGLFLDGSASRCEQYLLGACAWTILFGLLYGEGQQVRLQVAIAILAATVCEYTFAPTYHIYIYRFDNVPAYVPPGHGMVYLTAVALARSALFIRGQRAITLAVLGIGAAWALWGVTLSARMDTGGAVLFLVFAGFVLLGRSPRVYLGAFLITSYLELWGTHWGTWAWAEYWPSWGNLPQANPPSGIAAGYCFLDAIALTGAPWLARLVDYGRWMAPSLTPIRIEVESDSRPRDLDDSNR
jgi:hypothetical protein